MNVKVIADSCVPRRDYIGLSVDAEADVANEGLVEN
jgi:hypothetical protein